VFCFSFMKVEGKHLGWNLILKIAA
jgi:hypothetical protein